MGRNRTVLLLTIILLAASSCASNLSFRVDHRLHWQAPSARSLVQLPVTLRWNFSGSQDSYAHFAVFVDRAPIKPGQTLRAVAGGDQSCRTDPTCPDATYLADRRVYETTATDLTLSQVPTLAGDADKVQLHQATVILLDASGRRIGESAWIREFKLRRPSA